MKKNEPNSPADTSGIQQILLRDYLAVLKKRQATVLTFLIITLLLVTIGTFSMTPIYTASSQILIEKNYGNNSLEGTSYYSSYDPQFLSTQFKIIKSSDVIKKVVRRLQLDTKYRDFFIKDKDKQFVFLESLKQKIVGLFKVFSPQDLKQTGEGIGDSRLLIQAAKPVSDTDIIVEKIQDNLEIKPEQDTKIVNIMYSHRYPAMAKLITDFIVKAYKEELQAIKYSSSTETLTWMTKQSEEERKKLADSELALQAYMKKNNIIMIENKLAIYPQKLSEFSSQLSIVQAKRKKLESIYFQIKNAKEHSLDVETLPVFANNKTLQALLGKIYTSKQNINELSRTYGYKNPVMIKAKEKLNSLKKEKESEIQKIFQGTKNAYDLAVSQEKNITDLLNATKNELLNLNEKSVQYSIMKRDVDTNSALYDTLTASLKKASVTQQAQNVNVWVLQEASLPRYPSRPRKVLNLLLGSILGFLGGVGLAFFLEYLDNTVQSPGEIEQRFGLTVLGAIEQLKGKDQKVESFIQQDPLSPFAESYRLIRSNILLSSVDHPPRRILFTSMAPSEGKTATTVNIARILAQSDKKVLVMDCDLRRPRQHTLFSIPNSVGLSSYLTGNTKENIVQRIQGEAFSLVTAGPVPPNPAELLDSARMKALLDRMADIYDFVLLDSPPLQSVTDSLSLSTIVDGTIIVVRAGETTYDMIENGLRQLKSINAHLLGFILNAVSKNTGAEGYYHGYYKYYSKND